MIYKITKRYRNATDIYYIKLDDGEEVTENILAHIGLNTEGGHRYGYEMESEAVDALPEGASLLPRMRTVQIY